MFVKSRRFGNAITEQLNSKYQAGFATYIDSSSKDSSEFRSIATTQKFRSSVLVTTTVLDNGVNIKDKFVKYIIISFFDYVANIQALGRIRMEKDMVLDVYVIVPSVGDLKQELSRVEKTIEEYNEVKENTKEYVLNCAKKVTQSSTINMLRLQGNEYKLNEFAFVYLNHRKQFLQRMIKELETNPDACLDEILWWYGFNEDKKYLGYSEKKCFFTNGLKKT